jgi:hypothetical protein
MATIYDIIEENLRNQAIQRDIARDSQGQGIGSIDQRFMGSAPSNDINQIILNNIAQLSDANEGNIGTDDVLQEPGLFQRGYDYLSGDRGGIARGILGLLTGGPIGALIGYNSPNIMSGVSDGISGLFKNFNDIRRGRLDVTADAGIMPTGIEIGAAQGSDAGFDNSDSGGYSGSANDGTADAGYGSSDDGFR